MKKQLATIKDVRRKLTKRITTNDGLGFTWVPDGAEVADIVVYVNVDALVRSIGTKAIRSKNRVTKLQGGAIQLHAVNIRREAQS